MTVYFIHMIADQSQIKIGSSRDLKTRLRSLASSHGDIKMFAQSEGGLETERLYQKAFAHLRIEGEWFRSSPELLSFIAENSEPADAVFVQERSKWATKAADTRSEQDAAVARSLMGQLMDTYPSTLTRGAAREKAFVALSRMNPAWSRRRVRAIWESRGLRVDLYEIVDLLTALQIHLSLWGGIINPAAHRTKVARPGEEMGR